jgi:hypothetical protein
MMKYHSLERTSPKGGPFIGTCVLCGTKNLPMSAARQECENWRGLSQDDAIIEAIKGPTGAGS